MALELRFGAWHAVMPMRVNATPNPEPTGLQQGQTEFSTEHPRREKLKRTGSQGVGVRLTELKERQMES